MCDLDKYIVPPVCDIVWFEKYHWFTEACVLVMYGSDKYHLCPKLRSHESPKYRNTTEIPEYPWKI